MTATTLRRTTELVLTLLAAAANAGQAQQLTAMTMPLKDGATNNWMVYGDELVGVDVDRGFLKMSGRINAYSLADGKFLWRQEVDLGYKMNELGPVIRFQEGRSRMLLGNGPVSLVGREGPKWTLGCDKLGPVYTSRAVQLQPDRLLLFGNDSCKNGFKDDIQVMLVDGATGKVLWTYKSKGQWFDIPGGYWARVARFQGGPKTKSLQFAAWPLAQGPNGYESGNTTLSADGSADGDRVLVIGERMEILNMADGSLVWRSPQKVDRLEGLYGPFVFLRDGDKLSAVKAGTGEAGWTLDLDRAGTTLYSAAQLEDMGEASPLGAGDLLVSEHRFVSRVDLMTGRKKWTVEREGAAWQGTASALLVESDKSVIAYDWASGAKRWEVKEGGTLRGFGDFSQPVALLVDRGKREEGEWVGPYTVFAVETATGRVAWSHADLDGKRIASFDLTIPGQVRLTSDAGKVANFSLADGSPASLPPGGPERFVAYSATAKALQCRDYAGNVIWERRGEISPNSEVPLKGDLVVWAAKSGDVEVIGLADGTSRWKLSAGSNPRAYSDDARKYLVVPHSGSVSVVRLGS